MSCLFDSLSYFITNIDSQRLRSMIVNYLSTNPKLIEDNKFSDLLIFEDQPVSLENYIQNMSDHNTWGGAIEIKAFADMFNVRILVNVIQTGKQIEFLPKNPFTSTICLLYTGNHYEPLSIMPSNDKINLKKIY